MKFKHVVASLSLAMFTAFGVGAGLSMKKEAKAVKADDPKTAMMSMTLDVSALETAYETSNYRVHVWGSNIDETIAMHESGQSNVYTVIVTFTGSQVVEGAQFIFYQSDGEYPGDKYSQNLNLFADGSYVVDDEHNNGICFAWESTTNWNDGHWEASTRSYILTPRLGYQTKIGAETVPCNLILEPENQRYAYYDLEITAGNTDIVSFECPARTVGFHPYYMLNKYAKEALGYASGSDYWTYFPEGGTYDVFVENYYDGEGIISIRKHEGPTSASIYYVTNSASATGDYIYSWGGSEQFGAFPGTPITSIVGVKELTGNGVIHFQGGETAKLIYEIPVEIGYPTGDAMFMFDNGTEEYKSDERALVDEAAYWWTGPANGEAGDAIEFLVYAEARRNAVEDYSVCNIIEANATAIVNMYNSFDPEVAATYIDCTTVYTWADASKESETLVSYKSVVEQLGRMYNIPVNGSSLYFGGLDMAASGNVAIIVIAVTATSALALTLLLVFKKRKHQ